MSLHTRSITSSLAPLALLFASTVALATTYLNLDTISGTAPVEVEMSDGTVVLGFEIDDNDTFPIDGVLSGTVNGDGALVLDGDDLAVSGVEPIYLLGATRLVNYSFTAIGDMTGEIVPYDGDLRLSFRMGAVLTINWDDGKVYTCTGQTPTINTYSSYGVDYDDSTGEATVEGTFDIPSVSCTGGRKVTATALQGAINLITGANPETVITIPVTFDPVLVQDEPEASCGSHPSGTSWTQLSPPNCHGSDPDCDVEYCTCDDGDETCTIY